MKEFNEDYTDLDNNNNNLNDFDNRPIFDQQNDLISPIKDLLNDNNKEQIFNNSNKIIDIDNNGPIDNNFFSPNENIHFQRYFLNDEQKKHLTPRDSSFIYKILDFLFNW